jgi:hypothetical protein
MKTDTTIITEQDFIDAQEQYLNLSDSELARLAKKAVDEQPAIFAFIAASYDLLKEDENKEFYVQLVYSIWIAYNKKYKLKRKLNIKEVEDMNEADEKLMNELYNSEDALIGEVMKRMTKHSQATLIGYLYTLIGDFFKLDELQDEDFENDSYRDSGIISGAVNSFVNLLEKSRQDLYVS